jgi:hypothetical protein
VEHATSTAELVAAMQPRKSQISDPVGGSPQPAYDAVDLARMGAALKKPTRSPSRNRYTTLIVVVVLFAILLGLGIWLASRLHSSSPTSTVEAVRIAAYSSASAPPSPFSPLR